MLIPTGLFAFAWYLLMVLTHRKGTSATLAANAALAGLVASFVACGDSPAPPPEQRVSATEPAPSQAEPTLDPAGAGAPNGFGDVIEWRKYEVAMQEAKDSGKPVMMVVHTPWCGRCKALKPNFTQPEVTEMAKEFVMVNVDQDSVPAAGRFAPDGTYIPRVMFFTSDGELDETLQNERSPKYKYFYTARQDLTKSMKEALWRHGKKG